jgi:hypothetical protein
MAAGKSPRTPSSMGRAMQDCIVRQRYGAVQVRLCARKVKR